MKITIPIPPQSPLSPLPSATLPLPPPSAPSSSPPTPPRTPPQSSSTPSHLSSVSLSLKGGNTGKGREVRGSTPLPPGKNRVKKMKTSQKKSDKKSNTTRQYTKHTIKRMSAQDKQLIKSTFHDISKFTTRFTSPGMDTTLTPQAWRGAEGPTRRTYGSSRSRGPAGVPAGGAVGAQAGAGVASRTGPLSLPVAPVPGTSGGGSSSPYSPSRPTESNASPASPNPGERAKPSGTWAARSMPEVNGRS